MKKSNLILVSSLVTLLGIGLVSNVNADSVWHAKTPSEIGNLNSDGTYTVREGDTIWAIGMHFNIKPAVIESINDINDPYTLQIGTILKINVKDHGNKAVLSVDNGQETAQATLNNSDKIDKNKSFGEKVTPNEASKAQKEKNFNSTSSVKVTEKQDDNNTTNESGNSSSKATSTNNSTTGVNSATQNSSTNVSNQVIGMLAYMETYKDNISPKDIYVVGNGIGQGTADSTGTYQVNGDSVTFTTNSGQSSTYNVNDLINKYYSTAQQKEQVNGYISQGEATASSLGY